MPRSVPAATLATESRPRQFYPNWHQWLWAGFRRYPIGSSSALVVAWTGLAYAVYAGLFGFFIAIVVFVLELVFHIPGWTSVLGSTPTNANIVVVFFAALIHGVGLFVGAFFNALFGDLGATFVALLCGAVIAVIAVSFVGLMDEPTLRLQGYRRISVDENRRVAPLAQSAATAMHLGTLPRIAMSDKLNRPDAWMAQRTLVLSRSLLFMLNDRELKAVIAHELAHWRRADAIGRSFITWAGWPLIFWYQLGSWMATQDPFAGVEYNVKEKVEKAVRAASKQAAWTGKQEGGKRRPSEAGQLGSEAVSFLGVQASMFGKGVLTPRGFVPLLGRVIAFPCAVFVNWVVIPLTAKECRSSEYAADALVKEAGLGEDLAAALSKIQWFELGPRGLTRKLAEHHPPIELRVEALRTAKPDDHLYREPELGYRAWGVAAKVAPIAIGGFVVVGIISALLGSHPFPGHTTGTPTVTPTDPPGPLAPAGEAPQFDVYFGFIGPPSWVAPGQGHPAEIYFHVTVANRGHDTAQQVRLLLVSSSQFVPILSLPGTQCIPDAQSSTQADLPDIPSGMQTDCDVYYDAMTLGTNSFRVAVYANGNGTQPALSAPYMCEPQQLRGELCHAG